MQIQKRSELIVWLYSTRNRRQLQKFGQVHYVSRRMKYAVLYVNQEEVEQKKKALEKQKFVRKVEPSYRQEIDMTFKDSLKGVENLSALNLSKHETASSIDELVRALQKEEA